MSILETKGMAVYALIDGAIEKFECLNNIETGSDSVDRQDVTCYEDEFRRFKTGMAQAGEGTLGFQLDDENPTHTRIIQLADEGLSDIQFIFAMKNGPASAVPTVEDGELVLPTTRTWFTFTGDLSNPTPAFELGGVVTYTVTIQRNSKLKYIPKVETAEGG